MKRKSALNEQGSTEMDYPKNDDVFIPYADREQPVEAVPAPEQRTAEGVYVALTPIKLPPEYEPLRSVLERAYAERGINSQEDILTDPQIEEKLRKAHQQFIRFTVIDVLRANREE